MALCINNNSSDVMVLMLIVAFAQAFVLKLLKSLYNDIMIGAEEDAKAQREASELEAKEKAIEQSIEEGTSRYSDLSSSEKEGDEETGCESCTCPICLDDFESADEVFLVKTCRHEFHKKCIKKWLCDRKILSCPYCREPILTIEQESEESVMTFSVIQLLNSSIVWKYRRTLLFALFTEAAVCVTVVLQIKGC